MIKDSRALIRRLLSLHNFLYEGKNMTSATAKLLHEKQEKILNLWQERAYKEVKASLGQTSLVLKNSMATFFTQLEEKLIYHERGLNHTYEEKDEREQAQKKAFGKKHGISRAGTLNYSIDQVIYEYHILREVIFEVLEADQPLGRGERDLIITTIEHAVNLSATSFSNTLRVVRERFVSAFSHDLKTPVTSAMLSAQMILKNPQDTEYAQRSAMGIVKSMNRLERMIADLLDASRLEAGEKVDLEFESFDMNSLLQEVLLNCELNYGKRFTLNSDGPAEGFWSYDGIRRALENLTSNAVKYSYPQSPISINLASSTDYIRLSVKNEGKPISKEHQEIIFQQYRRISTTDYQQGWGIGLLLSKGIIEVQGGWISLESTQEDGTIFTVELPRLVIAEEHH